MPDNDTLLAYLVSSFPGNTEDIATEALRHIFDRSDACGDALNDVIRSGVHGVNAVTRVRSQVIHADGARPDLVGFDDTEAERVLIEVKFWADLTPNQPNAYINHLPDDGPALLMFLTPEDRIQYLWPELLERVGQQFDSLVEIASERKCLRLGDTQKHLMIVSWGGLLDSMAARTRDYAEVGVETEIRQLRIMAKYADNGSVIPTNGDTVLDSEELQRLYRRLVDASTERGIEQEWASRKGLRATPRGYGYGRYVRLRGTIVWFGINVELFEMTGETPLWVDLCVKWNPYLRDMPSKAWNDLRMRDSQWVPVALRRGVEYPVILDGVVDSLKQIADVLCEVGSQSP